MKTKALLSIAVASAFACSAAYAGSGAKHSAWVASGDEHYPAMIFGTEQPRGIAGLEPEAAAAMGATASELQSSVGGSFNSDGSDRSSGGSEELSSLTLDENLELADQGIYSDFMLVSLEPVAIESWDLYVLEPADELALSDFMIAPSDVIVLYEIDTASAESMG